MSQRTTTVKSAVLGDLTIAGLKMSQRFQVTRESGEDNDLLVASLLAISILGSNGKPLKTADEWDEYGGEHFTDAMMLFGEVMRFNDFNGEDAQKK